ncbi:hypothetical protein UO65_0982 [Actinokineospora spheciospongiae]|uniref:FHA domain-containing protein n=1 Tax=Actinokineospora spheciospongiae TaxID=909613 RepID=W7IRY8_9PSEU|nr:hypothetical protein [Actinokineospora spheciospongiae]EWC63685.1 hypothetical protein UO65_0982 [Actinokineospora spheciospongiae]
MKLDDFKVAVRPGPGLVGRFPTSVLLLAGDDRPDAGANAHDKLIGLFSDGAELGPRLEAMFAAPGPTESASVFAAVVETGERVHVYLHGPLEVSADSPTAELRVWGQPGGGLRRYDAPDGIGSLSIRGVGEQISTDTASLSLRNGLVSGGGLVLHRDGAEPPARPTEMAPMAAEHDAQASGNGGTGTMTAAPPAPPASQPMSQPMSQSGSQPAPQPVSHRMSQPMTRPTPVQSPPTGQVHTAAPSFTGGPPVFPTSGARPQPTRSGGTPDWLDQGNRSDTEAATGAPTPSYGSRIGARLISTAIVGGLATLLLGFVLPVGFAPLEDVYLSTFIGLGLLFVLGAVVWDFIFDTLQRRRSAKDWPVAFLLAQAVPEAALAYGAQTLLLPDGYVVDEVALAIDLGVVAVLISLGTLLLGKVPPTRKLLYRRTPATAGGSSTDGPGGFHSLPGSPTTAQSAGGSAANTPMVWGINCQQGHFNRPDARYCAACGTAMHGLTHEPRQGPRPPLGYLIGDDGASHVLDRDVVLGTAPHHDDKVRTGQAVALAVADGTGLLADSHADIALSEWDVTVVDRGHPQGTHVREPDSATWVRLAPGQPFTVASGSRIRLGSRDLAYHAANTR